MLTNKQALDILKLDEYATHEEVRSAYKSALKKHHPDVDKSDGAFLRSVIEAFQLLDKSHKPKQRPITVLNRNVFFRVFKDDGFHHSVTIPQVDMTEPIEIRGMWHNKEVRIVLPAGTKIPIEVKVKNFIVEPFFVRISFE